MFPLLVRYQGITRGRTVSLISVVRYTWAVYGRFVWDLSCFLFELRGTGGGTTGGRGVLYRNDQFLRFLRVLSF